MIGSHLSDPMFLAILIPLFVVSIVLHEFGHAFVADFLGDPTPRNAGRVTLNPVPHLDFFGTVFLLFAGFGWAKPVPVNPGNLRWPRLGNFLVSAAGPFTNFVLAVAALLGLKYLSPMSSGAEMWFSIAFMLNVALMVLNLLPIPPLDGGHLLEAVIPRRWLPHYEHLMPYGVVLLLVLVFMPGPFKPLHWLNQAAADEMVRVFG
jgi:Zn-dependent protease